MAVGAHDIALIHFFDERFNGRIPLAYISHFFNTGSVIELKGVRAEVVPTIDASLNNFSCARNPQRLASSRRFKFSDSAVHTGGESKTVSPFSDHACNSTDGVIHSLLT